MTSYFCRFCNKPKGIMAFCGCDAELNWIKRENGKFKIKLKPIKKAIPETKPSLCVECGINPIGKNSKSNLCRACWENEYYDKK